MLNGIKEWFGTSGKLPVSPDHPDGTGIFVEVEELRVCLFWPREKAEIKRSRREAASEGNTSLPKKGADWNTPKLEPMNRVMMCVTSTGGSRQGPNGHTPSFSGKNVNVP